MEAGHILALLLLADVEAFPLTESFATTSSGIFQDVPDSRTDFYLLPRVSSTFISFHKSPPTFINSNSFHRLSPTCTVHRSLQVYHRLSSTSSNAHEYRPWTSIIRLETPVYYLLPLKLVKASMEEMWMDVMSSSMLIYQPDMN